jgi:hypothetical protein
MSKEYHFDIYGPPEILTGEAENFITKIAEKCNGEWIGSGTAFDEGVMERDIAFIFYTNKYRARFKKEMEGLFKTFPKDVINFNLYVTDEDE